MAFKLVQDKSDSADYPNSYYHASQNRKLSLTSLDGSRRADVCIIGGGYTGLSSALHLAERGYDVVLLEARKPGWGASGRNGGQLCSGQRKDQIELAEMAGKDTAHQLWELAEAAKDLAKHLIALRVVLTFLFRIACVAVATWLLVVTRTETAILAHIAFYITAVTCGYIALGATSFRVWVLYLTGFILFAQLRGFADGIGTPVQFDYAISMTAPLIPTEPF